MSFYQLPKKSFNKDSSPKERKNKTVYSKKVKLPTQLKSKKCSFCNELAVIRVGVSGKVHRMLCKKHLDDYNRRDGKYSVRFEKANG